MEAEVSQIIRHELRAMNTDCLFLVQPHPGSDPVPGVYHAVAKIREYEARFSRFLDDSDLTRLNNDSRERVRVSAELAVLLGRALEYARLTYGVFDPVVLAEMRAIGYDRSFEQVKAGTHAGTATEVRRFRWTDVQIDVRARVVTRPPGALIDLGGLAKGAAADAATAKLAGHPGALVDLGGDIRTTGGPGDADFWLVGMDDGEEQTIDVIGLRDGAIATSSASKRRWMNNGSPVHHVIDPRSGLPADSGALQCSVIADTAEHAEVAAKVGLVLGAGSISEQDEPGRSLGLRGAAWVTTGDYVYTPGWEEHVQR